MNAAGSSQTGRADGHSAGGNRMNPGRSGVPGQRLRLRQNPLRLAVTSAPRAACYLGMYLLVSWLLFAIAFSALSTVAVLCITVIGIPLLAMVPVLIRGCANVERAMLRMVYREPVPASERTEVPGGMLAHISARWHDGATWREIAYLIALWAPLYCLATAVLAIWLSFLGSVTMPIWYWAPRHYNLGYVAGGQPAKGIPIGYFPHGVHGRGIIGLYVNSLPTALLAAVLFLVLLLAFNYVLVATARLHAKVARSLLHAPDDPLAPAKEVLAAPGPLGPLVHPQNGVARAGRPA
ncbi:MAG TPA: sensor domain-containing protein [Streptosporangiaceae bacterium]